MIYCKTRHEAEERVVSLTEDIVAIREGAYDFAPEAEVYELLDECYREISTIEHEWGFRTDFHRGYYTFTLTK